VQLNPELFTLVNFILFLPLVAAVLIGISKPNMARNWALGISGLMVVLSGWLVKEFDPVKVGFSFESRATWIQSPFPVQFHTGIDGFSLSLVVMTAIVGLFAIYASDKVGENRSKLYYSFVMLLLCSILGVFVSLDLLMFFVLYEFELVPMYFLIAIWGGPRREYAAMKFLLYTFFGGVLMLAGLLYAYFQLFAESPALATFDMVTLSERCPLLPLEVQGLAFLGFFLAFIIKLPSFPFHTWLPDAHVEAPTPISMILAGLLLKMGSYGLIRICVGLFPQIVAEFGYLILALGCFNIVWGAVACLVQQDMKRIIAFSSISHMGFVLVGMGALSAAAINGAIFQMVSHGFIAAALFFLVGTVYERTHTRQLPEIGGGLAKQMPTLFYFWMFAALANLGLPLLSGFVAETAVFYGAFTGYTATLGQHAAFTRDWIYFATTSVVLTAGYMLWLLKRLFFGPEQPKWVGHLTDARPSEKLLAWAMTAIIIALGVYPYMLTKKYQQVSDKMASFLLTKAQTQTGMLPGSTGKWQ
jgi:NADH-quinone oxidoreductase subunit M